MKLPMVKTKHFVFHPHSYGIATLMRIGVRIRGRQLLLHHFRPHQESEFHDHPWSFRTRVLWGSYRDESPCPECHGSGRGRAYGPVGAPEGEWRWDACGGCGGSGVKVDILRRGERRYRPALHAHRTSCIRHTWTLVLTGPAEREWCKGTPENWVCNGQVADFDATRGMVRIDEGP